MNKIRIIGDIHGKFHAYKRKIEEVESSIQLGDFGFAQEWYQLIRHKINPNQHKIIPGNHEDYYGIRNEYTFGTDWGIKDFFNFNFFFIRGAWSIDQKYRIIGKSWWPQEEIEYKFLQIAIEEYCDEKPDIVLSHECPGDHTGISTIMFQKTWHPNRTSLALQTMWNTYHPKLWIFGHWHQTLMYKFKETTFVCLDELDCIDYYTKKDTNWNIDNIEKQVKKIYSKKKPLRY